MSTSCYCLNFPTEDACCFYVSLGHVSFSPPYAGSKPRASQMQVKYSPLSYIPCPRKHLWYLFVIGLMLDASGVENNEGNAVPYLSIQGEHKNKRIYFRAGIMIRVYSES